MAVGLAPQDLNLDWFLTVEESLDYHGGYFGMPRRERASAPQSCSTRSRSPRRRTTARARSRAG